MSAPKILTKTEVAEGYDKIAGHLRMSPKFYRLCRRLLAPHIQPGNRVVDLGCGQGRLLAEFQASFPQARFCGVDISHRLTQITRERVPTADILQGDVENLPLRDGQFDVALMTEVLEHLPSPQAALKQVLRILKPGGWLLLSMPNRDWFRYEEYATKRRRYQPVDDHWYSMNEMRELMKTAGFEIRRVHGAENLYFGGGLPRLAEKMALLVYPKLYHRMKRAIFLTQKPVTPCNEHGGLDSAPPTWKDEQNEPGFYRKRNAGKPDK